jgi:hypothetical protein
MTAAERREKITAEIAAATGITEAMIERLVRGFYAKVRSDPALAPIFDARIQNWEPHLQQMCAFWSSVTLMSGRYHGGQSTCRCRSMPAILIAGLSYSRPPRASFVHRRLLRISSNARGGSRRAWNSGSQMRTASCPASARGFGVTEEEPSHAPPNQRRD